MSKFLVATDFVVFAEGSTYGKGSVFVVADDDRGQGCYQAREANVFDGEPESFKVEDGDFNCIPATSIVECSTWKQAVKKSYQYTEDVGDDTLQDWLEAYA